MDGFGPVVSATASADGGVAPGSRPVGLRSPEWRVTDRGKSPGMGEGHPHPLELWVRVAFVRTYWTRATLTHTDATPPRSIPPARKAIPHRYRA